MPRTNLDIDVKKLKPFKHNSRTHSEAQVAQIVASIREFGFTKPILIDEENTILAGHGGVRAAVQLTGLTAAQKSAMVIADNKIALNAGWDIDKPQKSETGHSTQKPVECMRKPMENNSSPGDFVYDPFLGSGTTVIAGEAIGRIVLGLELNPVYVDVIVKRWQDFTGRDAIHAVKGEKFNAMRQNEEDRKS